MADDFLFLSNCADEVQVMFNLTNSFSSERRYKIHPVKTTLVSRITTRASREKNQNKQWYLGDSAVSENDKTEHLGLVRSVKEENELNVQKRTSLARRTLYSLIKTGLHGCNGLNPKISYKIYQVYVLPRLLYGLEVLSLNKKQLHELQKFHLDTLKNIQSLSTRTSNAAAYLLLGALPLEAEIEKRQLGLFYAVITSTNLTMQNLWKRQYSLQHEGSFFKRIAKVLIKYNLPSVSEILNFSKETWKLSVKKSVRVYWTEQLRKEAGERSTLERCNVDGLQIGSTHAVWDTVNSNRMDVMRAIVKVRILTGTYLLQVQRQKFGLDGVVDASCPLCLIEDEDLVHMLVRCPALSETRNSYLKDIKQCVQDCLGQHAWRDRIQDANTLVQLIVDCQKLVPNIIPDNTELLKTIEVKSRLLCYKLHMKRLYLCNINKEVPGVGMAADQHLIPN